MKYVIVGVHLRREDVEPLAVPLPCRGSDPEGLWLSGIEVPDDQPLSDRDLLIRTATARAALLERATFIAIRYGFAAHSEREVATKTAPHVDRWRKLLEAYRGEVEMTLKIAAAHPMARPVRGDFSSGTEYLTALHAASTSAEADPLFRAAVDEALRPLAVSSRWIHRDNSSIELAILLPREKVEELRVAGESLKQAFPRVPFLLSGPWPLEVFADADHE